AADADPAWDSIWVYDHFHTVPEPTLETTFECWTITATLARDTRRVKIGQMVGCNGYRNPALYAKIASTVDVASHGRLYAGIGAGWYEHEWRAYGYGFPDVPERMRMFREAVQIIHAMWTEPAPTFHGRHYTIDGAINEPRGVQTPHPPLWIGGGGERATLKLVAQYGDASNFG
ncbi:MAG: TIGR03560 family F420-dependent LLM class oxidoreductase, partial [Mycobacterium sp.]|nr:TIGR03560 family F420-dependent LLM class oxidoreductase [Mycobacterium sp.]